MPSVVPIDDPADPRIAAYAAVRERDLVGRGDGFIAEGEVVLRVLLSAGARTKAASVLVAENRLARLGPLLDGLAEDVPVYAARQPVMDALVGFHIHRGILAHGLRPPDLARRRCWAPCRAGRWCWRCSASRTTTTSAVSSATPPRSASPPCCSTRPAAIRSTARPSASRSVRR